MIININTRVRIYLLFVLFNLTKTTNAIPPDLTFIIKTNDSGYIRPLCIGEADVLSSAVTWIYPIPDDVEKLPVINSSYVPQRNIEYSCNFGKLKKCNNIWQTYGWQYSNFGPYNFKPIIDTRWESFPTYVTSNFTKEYSARIDIPNVFEVGFSIRAQKNAEIFVCEGWNPKNYPCYYLNVGGLDNKQMFLRKYKNGVPDKLSKNDTKLAKFKSESNVLSDDEWKTFSLSLNENGVIALKDVFNNVTLLNYTDKAVLKPVNFIVRSRNENALWKFHKNDFMFTNTTGTFKLGPEIELYGSELCISLYILMCTQCKMKFFIERNDQKNMLKEITNNGDAIWMEVKLQKEQIFEKIQVYAETDYSTYTKENKGFWAIDDVRVCIPNELKTTHLDINMTFKEFQKTHVTCQSLKHPNWRPIHQISSSTPVSDVTCNTSTSTSITLLWKPIVKETTLEEYSIVQYEGMDICKYDKDYANLDISSNIRKKSQGYVIDKNNEIELKKLVPYTFYNITFSNVADGFKKKFEMNTLPTDIPTKEELPRIVTMTISDTINEIKWDKPKCNDTYGPIIYQLYIKNEIGNDSRHFIDIVTKYKFDDLQPFTNYTLEIRTARYIQNLNNTKLSIKTIHNFTTKPGIAPKVENLELYSTDKMSANLRFDIPKQPRGIPKLVQIRWCHPLFLSGCLIEIYNLTKCQLWDFKYCLNITNLVENKKYQINVAIKNEDTFSYGTEETVYGTAVERVPGKPINLSYKMVNCNRSNGDCNLNITWMHPYNQNATITMFDVILNETSFTFTKDTSKKIHDVVIIKDKEYKNVYHCIVKYITVDVPYKILVRAVNNAYKGDFEQVLLKTNNPEDYVDQTPEFVECSNETMTFKLPKLDRRLNSSTLIVLVQDYDSNNKEHMTDDVVKLEMFGNKYKLCNEFGNTWVAKTINLSASDSQFVVVGDKTPSYIPQLKKDIINKPLAPDTEYCFTFVLINEYEYSEILTVYHSKHLYTQRNSMADKQESESKKGINAVFYILPIFLFLGLTACAVWFVRKHFIRKRLRGEHIYESMPFDDYFPEAVSNQNYDTLVHN